MRYGHHHSQTASAMAWLLEHPSDLPNADVTAVLTCRTAILTAMSARLERAIGGANVAGELFDARDDRTPALNRVATSSPLVLSEFMAQIPRHGAQTTALSDVLLRQENSPPVRAWIEAARHATLATDIVATAPGWMSHPERAWQVVGDVGLDQREAA